jgi:tetratricopeptide (TPR) repeat protein
VKRTQFCKIFCPVVLIILFLALPATCTEKPGLPAAPSTAEGAMAAGMGKEIPEWQARLELARLLSYTERYDESIAEYRKVLLARPDMHEVGIEMARVFYWSGRPDEAFDLYMGIPQDRLPESDRLVLADLYMTKEQYDEAETIFKEYLTRNPEDLSVKHKIAQLLSWRKKYDESLKFYAEILKSKPDDIQLRREYAYVLMWAGRHAESIAELQESLAQ